jgi:hypothetical protein
MSSSGRLSAEMMMNFLLMKVKIKRLFVFPVCSALLTGDENYKITQILL